MVVRLADRRTGECVLSRWASSTVSGEAQSDAAALNLLYLAIRNINQKRGAQGQGTYRWTEALNVFAIQFPDRLPL
jgi:transposase-like protein